MPSTASTRGAGTRGPNILDPELTPGAFVRHPDRPDWGVGQIQSVIDGRITVNFEHRGKQVINASVITLVTVDPETGD